MPRRRPDRQRQVELAHPAARAPGAQQLAQPAGAVGERARPGCIAGVYRPPARTGKRTSHFFPSEGIVAVGGARYQPGERQTMDLDKACAFFSLGAMLVTVNCLYRWFLRPALARLDPIVALQAVIAVHCFRFISPISLMHGVTVPGLSTEFTYPQVIGDVGTAALALLAIRALRQRGWAALSWVWFMNLFGAVDLAVIGVQGTRFHFAGHVGGMFYIVAWYVPWLILSHSIIFRRLMAPAVSPRASPA